MMFCRRQITNHSIIIHHCHTHNGRIIMLIILLWTRNNNHIRLSRDLVGNNLRFRSASFRSDNRNQSETDHLAPMLIYRDALRRNLTTPSRAGASLPRWVEWKSKNRWHRPIGLLCDRLLLFLLLLGCIMDVLEVHGDISNRRIHIPMAIFFSSMVNLISFDSHIRLYIMFLVLFRYCPRRWHD
jgi:hypothetical protein